MRTQRFAGAQTAQARGHRQLASALSVAITASLILSCSLVSAMGTGSGASDVPALATYSPEAIRQAEAVIVEGLGSLAVADLGQAGEELLALHLASRSEVLDRAFADLQAAVPRSGRIGLLSAVPRAQPQSLTMRGAFELYLMFAAPMMGIRDGTYPFEGDYPGNTSRSSVKMLVEKHGRTWDADITLSITTTAADGSSLTETLTARMVVDICPDPSGRVPLDISFDWAVGDVHLSGAGHLDGIVDDHADLASVESDLTLTVARHGTGAGSPQGEIVEIRYRFDVQPGNGESPPNVTRETKGITRSSEGVDQAMVDRIREGLRLAAMTYTYVLKMAEVQWQDGFCVEIIVEGVQDSNQVEPSSTSTFTARVRHKFEGTELKGPLTASLSGDQSVDPSEKTDAPANYTYIAGQMPDATATVNLETRSKRGVAKKTVAFTTGKTTTNWRPISDVAPWSGQVCFLDEPFTLKMSGIIPETYGFQPESENRGSFTMTMAIGQGCEVRGTGTYTVEITVPEDPTETEADITLNVTDQTMYCPAVTVPRPPTVLHILLEPYDDPACK